MSGVHHLTLDIVKSDILKLIPIFAMLGDSVFLVGWCLIVGCHLATLDLLKCLMLNRRLFDDINCIIIFGELFLQLLFRLLFKCLHLGWQGGHLRLNGPPLRLCGIFLGFCRRRNRFGLSLRYLSLGPVQSFLLKLFNL